MAIILTKKGVEILVDDFDFDYLNQYTWHITSHGYAKTHIKKIPIFMHRLIMDIKNKKIFVDHKDRNPLNNKRDNLRFCTHSENCKNKSPYGTSKYLGVSKYIQKNKYLNKSGELKIYISNPKYHAQIEVNGKNKSIGYFKSEVDAALAYNEHALKSYGEFANLNVIE